MSGECACGMEAVYPHVVVEGGKVVECCDRCYARISGEEPPYDHSTFADCEMTASND